MHDAGFWLGVPVAAVSSFALGGLWYSPFVFGKRAARELEKSARPYPSASARIMLGSFLFTVVEALAFAWLVKVFLVASSQGVAGGVWLPLNGLPPGLIFGLLVGGCFVAAATGMNYLFTGRSMGLLLIDGGFHLARFTLYGLVLGTW
jgi:hypothetical protein